MKIVAKIGGAQLEQPAARAALAASVREAIAAGHRIALVHGGGNQMRDFGQRLGLEERYDDGLRCTDAATAELATAVLGGLVNKELVQALQDAGVRAVGVSGADGGSFAATKLMPGGRDLGFVGAVETVRPELLELLLEARFVPVVATVAPLAAAADGDRARLYNINADMAAGPLAHALAADALLFLTDVPAVLDAARRPIGVLAADDLPRLREAGALAGGMLPKVATACAAAARDPRLRVVIAPAAGRSAVLAALAPGCGTRVVATLEGARDG